MVGLEKYNDAPFDTPFGPRTGPGGYPLGGYQGTVGGYGDFGYDPLTGNAAPKGLPPGFQGRSGFAGAAGAIIGGSRAAEQHLNVAYRDLFAKRALGALGARQESARRLGYEGRAMGLSGGLARRIGFEEDADTIRYIGEAAAEAEFGRETDLAELAKGTGSELAGLKLHELGFGMQAYLARKGLKANERNAYLGLGGDLLGAAAEYGASV